MNLPVRMQILQEIIRSYGGTDNSTSMPIFWPGGSGWFVLNGDPFIGTAGAELRSIPGLSIADEASASIVILANAKIASGTTTYYHQFSAPPGRLYIAPFLLVPGDSMHITSAYVYPIRE